MHFRLGIRAGLDRWLFAVVAALVSIDVLMSAIQFAGGVSLPPGVVRVFDLALEGSMPTWYSSAQLLLATGLLAVIASRKLAVRDSHRLAWLGLTIGFAFLSLDETASLHEEWGLLLRGVVRREGIFYFRWTIIALALMPVLLITFWSFLASLPRRTRLEMIAAGAVFLSGAVGLELVTGFMASRGSQQSFAYALVNAGENGLELLGIAMLVGTLLRYQGESSGTSYLDISFRASSLARFLAASIALLLAASVSISLLTGRGVDVPSVVSRSFDVMQERNIPTWFSSMLLAVGAVTCALIARARRALWREVAFGWSALAAILLLLSIDEVTELHEALAAWIQGHASGNEFTWPAVAGLLAAAPMASGLAWIRRHPVDLRRALGIAAGTFYSGALLCPIVASLLQSVGITRGLVTIGVLGEGLEMTGSAYLIVVLARHFGSPDVPDA